MTTDPCLLQAELAKLHVAQQRDGSGELDAGTIPAGRSSGSSSTTSSSTPSAADTPLSAPLSGLSGLFPGGGSGDSCKASSSSSTSRTSSLPDTAAVQDTGTDDPAAHHDPQICFDFTKGMCTRGDKCKFSHDIATIVQFNSKEKGICFDYLRNQCHRGLLCRFSHDLSNIAQQCQVYSNGSAAAPTKNRSGSICYDFVKGVCQRGSECRYSHDLTLIARMARGSGGAEADQAPPHADVCFDFLRGRCTRGEACKYSHNTAMLHGGLSPAAPGLNPMLLGLSPAANWPLSNPLDAHTAAAAAAAAAAAYAAGIPGMGLGTAPMGRVGMCGLGADSMTAAYGGAPMGAMPSPPGLSGMAPFAAGLMAAGTPRHASLDGGACGPVTDALTDQLALLMAVQQQQQHTINNNAMMGLAANAAAAAACSSALPGLGGFVLPPQSSALPLGPQQLSMDQMQMLLSRPADLNRLLEQSKALTQQQQQAVRPASLNGGGLATSSSLPNSLPAGSRFSDSGALCPGLPRAPSPKTTFTHANTYNPAAGGSSGSHLSRYSPDNNGGILAAAVAADKAASMQGMSQQQQHMLQSMPLPPGHLPRTNSAPQPMHQQINAAAAAAAAAAAGGGLKKQGSGVLAGPKAPGGWSASSHCDVPPGLPISKGSARDLISHSHGSASGTPKGADQLAGAASADDAGNLLPMSIQEIWLR